MDKGVKNLLILIFTGVVSSYSLVVLGYFPSFGFSIFSVIVLSLMFFFKQRKDPFFTAIYLAGVVLSIFVTIRANPELIFLNIVTILYISWVMILDREREKIFSLTKISNAPFTVFSQILKTKERVIGPIGQIGQISQISGLVESAGITVLVLIIIVPLLATVNPIFAGLVDIRNLVKFLAEESIFIWGTRIVFFLLFVVLGAKILTLLNIPPSSSEAELRRGEGGINFDLPKTVTALVLIIFFITQIQFYLTEGNDLTAIGYNNSRQTREVFFQLSLVVLVVGALIYNEKNIKVKQITYLLFGEMLFLTLMALKSDFDYVNNFGFTLKRLWGFTGIAGILGFLGILGKEYLVEFRKEIIVRNICLLWVGFLILVNVLNFDYLITHNLKSVSYMGVDYAYLASLSSDGAYSLEAWEKLKEKIGTVGKANFLEFQGGYQIFRRIQYLRGKYQKIDWRTFNLSEYQEYIRTQNMEIEEMDKFLENNY